MKYFVTTFKYHFYKVMIFYIVQYIALEKYLEYVSPFFEDNGT